MEEQKKRKIPRLLKGMLCGLMTLVIDFVAIPKLCIGLPDALWMLLMVLLPLVLALVLLWGQSPWFAFTGLPVQYALLWLLADWFSRLIGMSLDGLGGFAYIAYAVFWPLVVTVAQFGVLFLVRKKKKTQ